METQEFKKNVHIRVHSLIQHPGQPKEMHELRMPGELIERKGTSYLRYKEVQNGESVLAMVKLDTNEALIMRKGAVNMRLPFTQGKRRPGSYGNGPASFELIVETEKLDLTEQVDGLGGEFTVHYGLHSNGSLLGTYELTITYTEGTL